VGVKHPQKEGENQGPARKELWGNHHPFQSPGGVGAKWDQQVQKGTIERKVEGD